jgi:AraC-like DNA-binding protein/quercetin dioxygenase-like cupin family protein
MKNPRSEALPYFRTNEMMKSLDPSWASAENSMLNALVSRVEKIRLPDVSMHVEFGHVAVASPAQEVKDHLHTQMEIFRVESGQTTFFVADKPVRYRKGDVAMIPARTIHRWTNGKAASLFLAFMVSVEPASSQRSSLGYHIAGTLAAMNYRARHDEALMRALDGIWQETRGGRDDSLPICMGHLTVALTLLIRQLRDAAGYTMPHHSAALNERYVLAAQSYIRAHLSEELSVQRVADSVGVSARHLNRILSRGGLHSIGHCIERIRIEHALWLLRHGSYPIKTIAQLCGFRSTPYFSRVFRNHTGRPPSAIRHSIGKSASR